MPENEVLIHPSATVHSKARLDTGVRVGPYSFIGQNVTVGKNTRIEAHVFIDGLTEIGADCHIFPFSSFGTEPQDFTYQGEETLVKIGNRNVFREFFLVNRGTVKGGGKTLIGDNNYFMAYSHVAHDCIVGNETTFINCAHLAGHVTVDDFATVGTFSGVHQFCRVGKHAFIGGFSAIAQDVLPFSLVVGNRPALVYGLNVVGLRRKGFSRERMKTLKEMFKIILQSDLNTTQSVKRIQEQFPSSEDRDEILDFIENSRRGFIKKIAGKWEDESE